MSTPTSIPIPLLFLSLLLLAISVTCPRKFCSVKCATKGCNGDSVNNCNSKCMANWVVSGSTCVPNNNNFFYMQNTSPDIPGGSLIVMVSSITIYHSSFCGPTSLYGPFYGSATTIRIAEAAGIAAAYYAFTIYVGIQTIDSSSSEYWKKSSSFFIDFSNSSGPIQSNSYGMFGSTRVEGQKYCYRDKRSENWNRITQSYIYNIQNTPINFDLYCNQTNTTAMWGFRQFIIVYRTCHSACVTCFGGSSAQCTECVDNSTHTFWLSGNICDLVCQPGYGMASVPNYCILCDPYCTVCFDSPTNCSACTRVGNYTSFLFASNSTCLVNCPVGYFANKVSQTCDICSTNCAECLFVSTYCTVCPQDYGYNNHVCYLPCPVGYFNDTAIGSNCTLCSSFCISCVGPADLCTQCQTVSPYTSYLYNLTNLTGSCERVCPQGTYPQTYNGTGPNLCLICDISCTACTNSPSPCSVCAAGFYFYGTACLATCPALFFPSNMTGTGICYDCAIYCVQATITMHHPTVLNEQLYIDMSFSQQLNYSTFNMTEFQTISIDTSPEGYTMDMFDVRYVVMSNSLYRIIIEPKGYIFLYNATFRVTTRAENGITDYSQLGYPFSSISYDQVSTLTWFVIKGPQFSQVETNIMTSFSTLATKTNNLLASSYVQEIKKSGVFSLLFSGAQVTSLTVLSNSIMSQNLYQGIRVWSVFVHYDVPPYQKISNQTKRFVSPTVENQIRNAQQIHHGRALFSTDTMYWRFQRTGQTSFFIYDCYLPIFLIITCWILLIIAYKCKSSHWYPRHASKIFTVTHKVHEITLYYVVMASIVEFIYFEATSVQRIVSAVICVVFNVYYAIYHLYIYYDMLKYPMAEIGNKLYDYYVIRYGTFLKNIRYQQYNMNEEWSVKHWFRPYNFHFLSYYKKFLMIIVMPLFYEVQYAQMALLLLIQLFELVRVWAVWPFVSNKRNWIRVSLEAALALFFLVGLIQIKLINDIQSGDINQMDGTIKLFHGLGWVGFVLIFYFNLMFVIIISYDLCVGCRESNRRKMDHARTKYYFDKIQDYQKDNEEANKELVNRWVRLGNINGAYYGELPEINVRIEEYKMRITVGKFDVAVRKIGELRMMKPKSHRKKNNTVTSKKIEKKDVLEKHSHSELYNILHGVFKKYANNHVETVVLKTFINVFQEDFQAGEEVPLDRSNMFQKVELISFDNQRQEKELEEMEEGFPIEGKLFARF